jgi:hypothetical protein
MPRQFNEVTIVLFPVSRWSGEQSEETSKATGKIYRIQKLYQNIINYDMYLRIRFTRKMLMLKIRKYDLGEILRKIRGSFSNKYIGREMKGKNNKQSIQCPFRDAHFKKTKNRTIFQSA